jgi:cytochrome c-type biogenesis protein CcmH
MLMAHFGQPLECRGWPNSIHFDPLRSNKACTMTLWFVLASMTAAAIFVVVWPLVRANRRVSSGSDVVVYKDQLDEILRDRDAGLIGVSEAEAAQVEVSRRLLAAADAESVQSAVVLPASAAAVRWRFAVAAALAVSLGSVSIYLALGSPSLPGQPLASREKTPSMDAMLAQVETHLARNPNDARGWEVIAPIYMRLGRFDDAIKARRSALALGGETSERLAGLGEALIGAADGKVAAEAKALFERSVKLDGQNIKARYFLGLAAEQEGRPHEAAGLWRAMLAEAPPDAPYADFIRSEIMRVAGAPLDPAAMVARLAERLSRDGSDLQGWLQLVRSYIVLGSRDKAREAAADARRAVASDPDKVRQIDELVKALGLDG